MNTPKISQDESFIAIKRRKSRLFTDQVVTFLFGALFVFALSEDIRAALYYSSGAGMMFVLVYLFSIVGEIVIQPQTEFRFKQVLVLLILPLKFLLLLFPVLLFREYGFAFAPLFCAGVLLSVFAVVFSEWRGMNEEKRKLSN